MVIPQRSLLCEVTLHESRVQAADRLLLRLHQDRMVDLAGTLLAEELPHIRHAEVLVLVGSLLTSATLRELLGRLISLAW